MTETVAEDQCEVVNSHVALDLGETTEHIITFCGRDAFAVVVDADDDEVTVCLDHLDLGVEVVKRFNEEGN